MQLHDCKPCKNEFLADLDRNHNKYALRPVAKDMLKSMDPLFGEDIKERISWF